MRKSIGAIMKPLGHFESSKNQKSENRYAHIRLASSRCSNHPLYQFSHSEGIIRYLSYKLVPFGTIMGIWAIYDHLAIYGKFQLFHSFWEILPS